MFGSYDLWWRHFLWGCYVNLNVRWITTAIWFTISSLKANSLQLSWLLVEYAAGVALAKKNSKKQNGSSPVLSWFLLLFFFSLFSFWEEWKQNKKEADWGMWLRWRNSISRSLCYSLRHRVTSQPARLLHNIRRLLDSSSDSNSFRLSTHMTSRAGYVPLSFRILKMNMIHQNDDDRGEWKERNMPVVFRLSSFPNLWHTKKHTRR